MTATDAPESGELVTNVAPPTILRGLHRMEPLLTKPIWNWTAADVDALVESKLPEGMRIDYKRGLAVRSRKERIEVCKDVSGLANAQGGWLFYGIEEDESPEPLPAAVRPFEVGGDLTVAEDILDSSLQPRARFEARVIDVDGGQVVIVHVEPRQGALIMVQGYGEFRYYRRSGTRTIPMGNLEVSAARAREEDRASEVMELVEPPLPLLARISSRRQRDFEAMELRSTYSFRFDWQPEWRPLPVVVAVAMDALRPLIHHSVFSQLDPFPEPRDGLKGSRRILPMPAWKLNAFGMIKEELIDEEPPQRIRHRAAVFRNGVIEWGRRYRDADFEIPGQTYAEDVHDALKFMASVFSSVGYFGRLAIFVRIENAERAILELPQSSMERSREPGVEWLGHFAEVPVDDLLVDPTPVVKDAMDFISQGFGVLRSPYFDATTGDWRF